MAAPLAPTRDSLLAFPQKTVDIAGVGVVTIRQVSSLEWDAAVDASRPVDGERDATKHAAMVVACGLVEPAFDVDDWQAVANMPLTRLWLLFDAVNEFSGMGAGEEVGPRVDEFPADGDPAGAGAVDAAAAGEGVRDGAASDEAVAGG